MVEELLSVQVRRRAFKTVIRVFLGALNGPTQPCQHLHQS